MNGNEIGIKLADGSLYPVLGGDFTGRKRLVVTTARDNQESVQIELFRGGGQRAEEASYVGSLTLDNLAPAPKKEPEIELLLDLDEEGNLEAVASDPVSGAKRNLTVNLTSLASRERQPELDLASRPTAVKEQETLLTGETYPLSSTDRRKEHLEHPVRHRRRPLAVICWVVLALAVLAGVAYLVYRLLDGRPLGAVFGGGRTPVERAAPAEPEPAPPAAEPAAAPVEAEPAAAQKPAAKPEPAAAAKPPAAQAPASGEGVWYRIRWGDTLWDLAGTYYRNPWLYPRLAKANNISNPDLIIAGSRLFIPKQ